jgi:hypothetical protein
MTPLALGISAIVLCTPANYQHSERCTSPVASFVEVYNGFTGVLESGVVFTQMNVTNQLGIRLQRFEMESVRWWTSDRGIIHADSDLEALSVYLTL